MTPIEPNPPAVIRDSNSLSELAGQINAAHAAGEEATRKGLAFFRKVGVMLVRAKKQVAHGLWRDWLKKNVKFSPQSANNYMRIAAYWPRLSGASGLQDALRILADDGSAGPKSPTIGDLDGEEAHLPEEVVAEGDDGVAAGDEDNPYRKRVSDANPTALPTYQPALEFDSYTTAVKEARKIAGECKERLEAIRKLLPLLLDGAAGHDLRRLALENGFPIAEKRVERHKIGDNVGNLPTVEVSEYWPLLEKLEGLFGELEVIHYMRKT